jgi:hypothetical protein
MKKTLKHLESGQSFVEMSIGMVVLIVLLGGLFDIGRAFLILVSVENATGEGALYGATHPECLTTDHALAICGGTESVLGRIREEGKPLLDISKKNSVITVQIENGGIITAGSMLKVDVEYEYSPLTPIGHLLWGNRAKVTATARQQIMSPPKPGYQY